MNSRAASSVALSFSGAGHLLPYHLGAGSVLRKKLNVNAVAGSSSGAMAATAMAVLSDSRLDEYAREFIKEKGHALSLLEECIKDAFEDSSQIKPSFPLYVALTRCEDASPVLDNATGIIGTNEFYVLLQALGITL